MDLKDSEGLQARVAQYALPMQTAKVGRHRARNRRAPLTRRDLAAKGPATDEGDGFISQLFLVLKTDGRVLNPAERTETIPIPAICVDPRMSEQTKGRGCEGPTDSPKLAEPGLVWMFGGTPTCDVTQTGTPNG